MENSAEFFYTKLKSTLEPGRVLADFYATAYALDKSRAHVVMFNKLISIFGRFTAYFGLLDMIKSYPDGVDNSRAMLYTICQSRFERAHNDSSVKSYESLDSYIRNLQKAIDEMKDMKFDIPSSEGLEFDG